MGIAPSTPLTLALSPEGERDNTTVSAPEFNAAQRGLLERSFTNLDRPVFALRNLPEVVKGALFSRYSRTEKSLRRVLLDEFINEPDSGFDRLAGSPPVQGSPRSQGEPLPDPLRGSDRGSSDFRSEEHTSELQSPCNLV